MKTNIGTAFLNKIFDMAEKKEVLSFQESENSPNLFFIPYDGDRFLQFGFQEQGKFQFQQQFIAKWRVDTTKVKNISLKELPKEVLQEETEILY